MLKKPKSEYLYLPNLLTYFRIILVPCMIALQYSNWEHKQWTIGILIALSGISDFLDGYVARNWDRITEIGKFLDPIADKLTQFALALMVVYRFPFFKPFIFLFLVKELVTGMISFCLLMKGVKMDGSKWYGKVSTFVFYSTMLTIFFFPSLPPFVHKLLIVLSSGFMLLAFVLYFLLLTNMWIQCHDRPTVSWREAARILFKKQGGKVKETLSPIQAKRTASERRK